MVHAGIEEAAEPRFESRPGVEYKLREDGVQSWRLSWLQASEGSRKLFRPERFGDTVTLRCWNLPYVGQLFVEERGRLAATGLVCPVLHELRRDGICREGAQREQWWSYQFGGPCAENFGGPLPDRVCLLLRFESPCSLNRSTAFLQNWRHGNYTIYQGSQTQIAPWAT